MGQLKMYWYKKGHIDYTLPEGCTIRTHDDSCIDGWIETSIELTGGRPLTHEEFQIRMLDDPKITPERIFYVVNQEGKIVSTATAKVDPPDNNMLHMVTTHMNYKGFGYGKVVCAAVMNYMWEHNLLNVGLWTDDFRIPAIKIYLNLGFRPFLYEADMAERWKKILEVFNISEMEAYDSCRNIIILKAKE